VDKLLSLDGKVHLLNIKKTQGGSCLSARKKRYNPSSLTITEKPVHIANMNAHKDVKVKDSQSAGGRMVVIRRVRHGSQTGTSQFSDLNKGEGRGVI